MNGWDEGSEGTEEERKRRKDMQDRQDRFDRLQEELRETSRDFVDSEVPEQNIQEWYDIDGGEQRDDTIGVGRGMPEWQEQEVVVPHEYGHSVFKETPLGRIWKRYDEEANKAEAVRYKLDKIVEQMQEEAIKGSRDHGMDRLMGGPKEVMEYVSDILDTEWDSTPESQEKRERLESYMRGASALEEKLDSYEDVLKDRQFLLEVNEGVAYLFNLYHLLKNKGSVSHRAVRYIIGSSGKNFWTHDTHYRGMNKVLHGLDDVRDLFDRVTHSPKYDGDVEMTEHERKSMIEGIGSRIRELTYIDDLDSLKDTIYKEDTGLGMSYSPGEKKRKRNKGRDVAAVSAVIAFSASVFSYIHWFSEAGALPLPSRTSFFTLSPIAVPVGVLSSLVHMLPALMLFSLLFLEHRRTML
jgi:hypothetical protein